MKADGKLTLLLKSHGYSVTKPRLAVFQVFLEADEALTIPQIIEKAGNVDMVSVYRTLQLFEKTGVVHRIWNGFKSKVELSESFSPHHHHFTCLNCGKTVSLKSNSLEEALDSLEEENGFELIQHTVELSGLCRECRKSKERLPSSRK